MDIQVIYREGEPEYAVLPWADFQRLLRDAGHDSAGHARKRESEPVVAVPLSRLRALREEHKLTLEALARETGISPAYLHMIETGEREPSAVLLRAFGRVFNVQQWDV